MSVTFNRTTVQDNVTQGQSMKFIAYYRVSTKRQGQSGLGLEAQEKAVNTHLSHCGGELAGSFTEIESGKKSDRPQLEAALKKCRLTGSMLIIARLDRLSRNKSFLFNLMESKVKFVCADMPEANDLTISFLAVMAEYESELISKRTKAALAAAKARGVKLGNIATLTNRDTTTARETHVSIAKERNKDVKEVIELIKNDCKGTASLRYIAGQLNQGGYTTSRGKEWKPTSVNRVINQ